MRGARFGFVPARSLMISFSRFRTLIFWVFAEKDVLYPRLDARVDTMTEVSLASSLRDVR